MYRSDIQYRTYQDTETLALYFMKASPGVICDTDRVAPNVLVDYSKDGKIVSVDIHRAPQKTACHFFDTSLIVDDKKPLQITGDYDVDRDELVVMLCSSDYQQPARFEATEDEHMFLGLDSNGLICAVRFLHASASVCGFEAPASAI